MKKMNAAILLLSLLIPAALSLPVMAEQANGNKVEASADSVPISYSGLTALFTPDPNPYPAPPIPEFFYNPGHTQIPPSNPQTVQVHEGSAYYLITELRIGETTHTGVSCNVYTAEMNIATHNMNIQYDTVWYAGNLGDLSNGFAGNVKAKLYNYNPYTQTFDRIIVHLVMQGFGDFKWQTLMLSYDSDVDTELAWHGYCLTK